MIRKIGGSLAAKICGVSDYGTQWDAWRTLVDGWQPETNLPMRVGKALEKELLPELYRERLPSGSALYPSQEIDVNEWARAHLDAVMVMHDQRRVVEYKTASIRTMAKWGDSEDAIPTDYLMQVQFYMWASGYELADVAVLLGNEDFQVRTIHRDSELIARMVAQCERFWFENVVPQRPPEIDGSKACAEWIRERYPVVPPEEKAPLLQASNEDLELAKMYRDALLLEKEAKAKKSEASNKLRARIGDGRGIMGVALRQKNDVIKVFGE